MNIAARCRNNAACIEKTSNDIHLTVASQLLYSLHLFRPPRKGRVFFKVFSAKMVNASLNHFKRCDVDTAIGIIFLEAFAFFFGKFSNDKAHVEATIETGIVN